MTITLASESSALEYVKNAEIAEDLTEGIEDTATNAIDIDNLPKGLVIGRALLDVSKVPSTDVRAGVSLSMLFASRVAANDPKAIDDKSWFESYKNSLGQLGFRVERVTTQESETLKVGVSVHEAIIPFISSALGGAGPIILAALQNLKKIKSDSPWITLFNREASRFAIQEMHFGAAVTAGLETKITYAVARLDVQLQNTQILFFTVTNNTAKFTSETTPVVANNSLMAVIEPDLRRRLAKQIKSFIAEAKVD